LLALLCSCGKGSGQAKLAASASASAASLPSAAPPPSPSAVAPAASPTCRAIKVTGEAKVGEVPVATGDLVDGEAWLTLAKGAAVALKHSTTGRELTITGPALFRACRRGREQLLLPRGTVTVVTGMGARPGAEVLIATPLGAFRYSDADFTLAIDDKKLSIDVRTGQVDIDPAGSKAVQSPVHKLRLPLGKPDPVALVARCKDAAEAAEASARRVGDKTAPEPLGERAQAHVKARKAARAACTVAAAATGLVADPSDSAGLWAEAARWEGLWETIPRRNVGKAPEK
jgi:hypothetical protein